MVNAKEAIKSAYKAKYEARLKCLKEQFESKFKKNEHTWRSRLEFHKQALSKELLKNKEYEEVIKELSVRISEVERKNKDMQTLVYRSNAHSTVITNHKESTLAEPT